MTDKPDSDQPVTDQPPEAPAPDLKLEGDKPDSAQKSQDAPDFQVAFDKLSEQVRALQGDKDRGVERNKKAIAELADRVGDLNLTPEQKVAWDKIVLDDRLNRLEGSPPADKVPASTDSPADVAPAEVTVESVQQMIDEATKPAPTGASAVSPSGGTTPSRDVNAEEAAAELLELQKKPRSERTPQEVERAAELMQKIEEAD